MKYVSGYAGERYGLLGLSGVAIARCMRSYFSSAYTVYSGACTMVVPGTDEDRHNLCKECQSTPDEATTRVLGNHEECPMRNRASPGIPACLLIAQQSYLLICAPPAGTNAAGHCIIRGGSKGSPKVLQKRSTTKSVRPAKHKQSCCEPQSEHQNKHVTSPSL